MIKVSKGCLAQEELDEVQEAFAYGYFGLAYKVFEFEKAVGEYLGGGREIIAVNTGTSALHLAVDALGIGPGDEVIVPSLTFVAAFQAILATGARPVPCNVREDNLQIDLEDVERVYNERTKAVMPVHYAGSAVEIEKLYQYCQEKKLRVIEDAAHAFGSTYDGKKIGSFGDIVCFSFDSIKNITCGEGGAVSCKDRDIADIIRKKRLLGIERKNIQGTWKERSTTYEVAVTGYRYHMSNINAAIGLAQLKKIDSFIARRRELAMKYDTAFSAPDFSGRISILPIDYAECAPHIYVVKVGQGQRDALAAFLKEKEIETGINYIPNHIQPLFEDHREALVRTESIGHEILTLPLHCGLSDDDIDQVISQIANFYREV